MVKCTFQLQNMFSCSVCQTTLPIYWEQRQCFDHRSSHCQLGTISTNKISPKTYSQLHLFVNNEDSKGSSRNLRYLLIGIGWYITWGGGGGQLIVMFSKGRLNTSFSLALRLILGNRRRKSFSKHEKIYNKEKSILCIYLSLLTVREGGDLQLIALLNLSVLGYSFVVFHVKAKRK